MPNDLTTLEAAKEMLAKMVEVDAMQRHIRGYGFLDANDFARWSAAIEADERQPIETLPEDGDWFWAKPTYPYDEPPWVCVRYTGRLGDGSPCFSADGVDYDASDFECWHPLPKGE